jgi:uncharacterized protein YcfL
MSASRPGRNGMYKLAAVISLTFALVGCASVKPASVAGECKVFTSPDRVVKGVDAYDKKWIAKNTEAGIRICGWKRPAS